MKVLLIPAVLLHVVASLPSSDPENQRAARDLSAIAGGGLQSVGHDDHHHHHGAERAGRDNDNDDDDITTEKLHGGQYCSDISDYGDIVYNNEEEICCETTFKKECEEKTEVKWVEVTEIECEVKAWAECKMDWIKTDGLKCEMEEKTFQEQECEVVTKNITHIKKEPVCVNVTYDNCVSLWNRTDDGKQVWTGNEDCKPITWRKCELKDVEKQFPVPETECKPTNEIPYDSHVNGTKEMTVDIQTCEVKSAVDCQPKTRRSPASATWQECKDVPMNDCRPFKVRKPTQEKIHKLKCLVPSDGHARNVPEDYETGISK